MAPPEMVKVVPAAPDTGSVPVVVSNAPGPKPVLLFTSAPKPVPGNRAPQYPAALEIAGIPGRVLVQFVIDTAGRVETATLAVLSSTNPLFTAAVQKALPLWRFFPAEVGGRRVRQIVQIPILFSVPR